METLTIYKPTNHKRTEFNNERDWVAYQLIQMSQEKIQDFCSTLSDYLERLETEINSLETKKIIFWPSRREPRRIQKLNKEKETFKNVLKKYGEFKDISKFLADVVDQPFKSRRLTLNEVCKLCLDRKWCDL